MAYRIRAFTVAVAATLISAHSASSVEIKAPQQLLPQPAAINLPENKSLVHVPLDFARVLSLAGAAKTIVIGNPAIVDAVLSDQTNLVLTGKSIGSTNLIVAGEGNAPALNFLVQVIPNGVHVTTIHNGAQQQNFSCSRSCVLLPQQGPKSQ